MYDPLFSQFLKIQLFSLVMLLLSVSAIAHMLSTRKKPKSMIAWLLVILSMPYVGIPLYIVFSGRKIEKSILKKGQLLLTNQFPIVYRHSISDFLVTQHLPPPTQNNRVKICKDGVEAYEKLMILLKGARRSIYISTYIFGNDKITKEILDILVQKAKEGVEVKLLIDSLGSIWLELFPFSLRKLHKAGGEYAFFNSFLKNPVDFKINLRNHRKIILIDQKIVMSGGMNIAKEYLSATPHPKLWMDLSFILQGEAVLHYLEIFAFDWEYTTQAAIGIDPSQDFVPRKKSLVQVVPSGPDVQKDAYFEAMLYAPFVAKRRIWIVTPYFAPDQTILDALILARHRGVEVKIIVPDSSDHLVVDMARNGFLRELQEEGILIYFYKNRMLHAKAILVDEDFSVMGSANFDERSFFYNYETMSFFYSPQTVNATKEWIEMLVLECTKGLAPVGKVGRVFENIFKMLSPAI